MHHASSDQPRLIDPLGRRVDHVRVSLTDRRRVSHHRADAFDAVRVLRDYLTTDAPLLKKETGAGGGRWIELRAEAEGKSP